MLDFSSFTTWMAGAVIVVGICQWLKKLAQNLPKKVPSWLWSLLLPVVSFGAAYSLKGTALCWDALGIWAIAQMGYDLIVRAVQKKIDKDIAITDSMMTGK